MTRALLAAALLLAACRTAYPAPPPRAAAAAARPTHSDASDSGDVAAIEEREAACRRTLHGSAVAASLEAIDAVTEALGQFCSLEPVEDDPLLLRVYCRADALFQSGHYLRASADPFPCQGTPSQSAFECAGRILAARLLVPGHAQGVELVSIGHVDRQRIAGDSAFVRDPCVDLQHALGVPAAESWAPAETAAPADLAAWNHRLAWCRAAYAATETLRGLRAVAGPIRQLDASVVGAGTSWLDARRACPGGRGTSPGECTAARRVDVLVRIEPAERPIQSACHPPEAMRSAAARALYCLEDCTIARDVGRVRQRFVPQRSAYVLFGDSSTPADPAWLIRRIPGSTPRPTNLTALRAILGLPPPPPAP